MDCTPAQTQQTVAAFVQAFNAGSARRLDALFARPPVFKWYSTSGPGARLGSAAYDRTTLVRYLVRRHRAGERLRLTAFKWNANSNGYSHFTYRLQRSGAAYEGKGALVCTVRGPTIAVWSMGPSQ